MTITNVILIITISLLFLGLLIWFLVVNVGENYKSDYKGTYNNIITFVINLDRSKTRLQLITKECKKHNIKFERVKAVDGSKLNKQELINNGILNNRTHSNRRFGSKCKITRNILNCSSKDMMNDAEIGVYLSHYNIWKKMVDHKIGIATIFEDDIRLDKNFNNIYQKTLKNAPADWDIIFWGCHSKHSWGCRPKKSKNDNSLFVADRDKDCCKGERCVTGMYSYTINYKAAKKLLHGIFPITYPIDIYIMKENIKMYCIDNTKLVTEMSFNKNGNLKSTISSNKKNLI